MIKLFLFLAIACTGSLLAEPPSSTSSPLATSKQLHHISRSTWINLTIVSQNTSHKIEVLGVDSCEPDTTAFAQDIQTTEHLLKELEVLLKKNENK